MVIAKRKILHIVTNLSDGGLEKVVYLIIKHIDKNKYDHNIAVLTNKQNDFLVSRFKELPNVSDIKIFDFDNRLFSYNSVFKNLKQLFSLTAYIHRNKINIIHSHDFFPAFIARLSYLWSIVTFRKPERVIITLHNIYFWLKPFHHFINRILSNFTYKIVCVSNAVKEYSLKNDKIKNSKYKVIYNGVEADLYQPDEIVRNYYLNEFNLNKNDFIIGNIGVLSIRKGQKYLIKAFAELYKKYPQLKLIIFGSERSHEKEIAEEIYSMITEYKIENSVKIIPPRDDINKIYNMFNLYVMPSISEGQSLSAIEAMLNAKICLFSNIKPFEEMIENDVNGILFESQNYNDLLKKIEYIYINYKEKLVLGRTARKEALEKYDVNVMTSKYQELYSYIR